MTKAQAIHNFFSSFDLPAYDEAAVPTWADDAQTTEVKPPFLTYHFAISDFNGEPAAVICNVWDLSDSWEFVDGKADEIAKKIGSFKTIRCDDGLIVVTKGSPFSQPLSDGVYKRAFINLVFTFITN